MPEEDTGNNLYKVVKGLKGNHGFLYDLDALRSFSANNSVLIISGWCFSEDLTEVMSVRLQTKHSEIIARYGIKRTELVNFGKANRSLNAGFEISIPAPDGDLSFSLEAKLNGSDKWLIVMKGALGNESQTVENEGIYKRIDMNGKPYRVKNGFLFNLYETENIKADGSEYYLRGWCFNEDLSPIKGIRCVTDRSSIIGKYNLESIELVEKFGDNDTIFHSGFELSLNPRLGTTPITLEAQLEDEHWLTVIQGTLCLPLFPRKVNFIHE